MISEKEFQQQVCDLATIFGWDWQHAYDSRRSRHGWPDLALWRAPRFMLAELKTDKGKLTPHQEQRIASLQACLNEVYVWRPRDWDTILGLLK